MFLNKQKQTIWVQLKKIFTPASKFYKKNKAIISGDWSKIFLLLNKFKNLKTKPSRDSILENDYLPISNKTSLQTAKLLKSKRRYQLDKFFYVFNRTVVKFATFFIFILVATGVAFFANSPQKIAKASGPTITSITPSSSSTLGGAEVTINGTNFAQGGPQRVVTINNPGGVVTNYEGNVTVDTASLISANKLRSDCGDIRVKDSDGTTDLNYWIDGQCNSVSTVIWFKKPSLPAGNSTVVLKYGDSGLTSLSNINNFSFGGVLTNSNNKLWLSGNNIQTSNTFTPTFTNVVGVATSGADLTQTGSPNSWSSGVTSTEAITSGNGFVSARIQEGGASYRMIGLSKGNSDSNYTDIDFAIYPADSAIYVYESGGLGLNIGAYTTNDILSVEASGDKILYKKNGNTLYTSTVTLTAANYPLLLDSSFYTSGSTFKDVKMCIGICDSSSVQTWTDRSGNGNNATQATAANRPQIKTNIQNGKPVIRFDGVDDIFSVANNSALNSNQLSLFLVANHLATKDYEAFIGKTTSSSWNDGFGFTNTIGSGSQYGLWINNYISNRATANLPNNAYQQITTTYDQTNINYRLNGASISSFAYSDPINSSSANLIIGGIAGGYNLSGNISEIFFFNNALTTQDRQSVESYLNTKYNLYGSNPILSLAPETISSVNVSFGGTNSSLTTFVSTTQIKAIVPASTLTGYKTGSVDVVVTNPDGGSVTLTNGFSYAAPVISSITPNTGATLGGYEVTISGSNFTQGKYQKAITINNVGSSLADYQINFNLDTNSLISAGKMRSDCGDIRVKDSNGAINLNYWIESGCNTASTNIWVKVPSVSTGNKDIFVEYGDSSLASASNPDGVFILYDEFNGNSLNASKWNVTNSTGLTVSGGKLNLTSNVSQVVSNLNFGSDVILESKNNTVSDSTNGFTLMSFSGASNNNIGYLMHNGNDYTFINTGYIGLNYNYPFNTDRIIKFTTKATTTDIEIINPTNNVAEFQSLNMAKAVSNLPIAFGLRSDYITGQTFNTSYDWIRARKYTESVPTVSVGSEAGGFSTVTFGSNPATNVEFVSTTEIKAIVPASTLAGDKTGSVDVVVTNPDGVSSTLTNGFSYLPPSISSITANTGSTLGGYEVTIDGANFVNTGYKKSLTINNSGAVITNTATSFNLDTAALISAGKMRNDCGDIRIKNNDESQDLNYWIESGCNTTNTLIHFKIPSLTSGSNTFYLKYADNSLSSLSNRDSVYPAIASNLSSLRQWIKASDGPSTTTNGATVSSVSDRSGNSNDWNVQGGYSGATYNPTGINGKPSLSFNGSNSYQFTNRLTDIRTVIMVWNETAAGYGAGSFLLGDTNTYDFHRNGNYYFHPSLAPNITNGTFKVNGTAVNGTTFPAIYNSPTSFSIVTSSNANANTFDKDRTAHGPFIGQFGELMIFNQALSSDDVINLESYVSAKYNVNPNLVATVGAESGAGTGSIAFGGNNAIGIKFISTTQFKVTVPASTLPGNKTGSVDVVVTNPDGSSGTLTNGFTYAAPNISSITPNSGPNSGGTFVTINGSNFSNVKSAGTLISRQITINNPTTTITNYEGNITLDTASLITSGKLKSDCGDIRVKDNDETTDLNYWIDGDCNSANTVVWFKKPSLPAGNSTIFLKYGDSSLTSLSNINNFSFGSVLTSTNNRLWLSANSGVGTSTDGTAIQTWNDRSGNGNNATQATSGSRPILKNNIQNGKPVVRFDGVDDLISFGDLEISNAKNLTFVTLFKASRIRQYDGIFAKAYSSYGPYLGGDYSGNTGKVEFFVDSTRASGAYALSNSALNNNQSNLVISTYDGNLGSDNIKMFVNGSQQTKTGNSTVNIPNNNDKLAFGAEEGASASGYNFEGDIIENLAFDSTLSNTDRQSVETYLNNKYNLYGANPNVVVGNEDNNFSVYIGNNKLTNTTFVNSTTITGYIPAGTGTQNVSINNNDGTSGTLNNGFTYGVNGVPNPVFDLAITNNQSENVPLTWTAPFNNNSSISDYIIKYSTDNFNTETVVNDGVNTNTNYTITGLTPGTSYKFKVIAVNEIGNSIDSNIVSIDSLDCDTNLNGADLTPANGATLTGRYCNIGTFTISNGFTVNTAVGSKVKIYAQNASVLGTLNANSKGFQGVNQGNGQGAGGATIGNSYGAGGGYGGEGGKGATNNGIGGLSYGSITEPIDLGSSGSGRNTPDGAGGNGGGAIKLNITGTLTNNGSITSNGETPSGGYGGGGSGGSIWITTNTLAGSGTITANGGSGGSGYGGGGAGGRIALYYQVKTLSGTVSANGASPLYSQAGGAGTVYEKQGSQTYGNLRIDNNNIAGSDFSATPINSNSLSLTTLDNLIVTNKANAILNKDLSILNTSFDVNAGTVFTVNNTLTSNALTTLTNSGTFNFGTTGNWISNSISDITLSGLLTLNTYTLTTINTVTIQSSGNLTTTQNTTVTNTPYKKLDLTFNNLTINSGGQINTNSKGFQGVNQGNGQGAGGATIGNSYGAGGGYGGEGGKGATNNGIGGLSYGSITEPIDLGSSGSGRNTPDGAGGNGGGAIKLNITGTLTNNGSITSNGETPSGGYGGGGSGGSIWITTNTLAGSGTITANGGSGGSGYGGGGAGGRIALYYQVKTLSGTVSANGASPLYSQAGGAGTVYEKISSDEFGSLTISSNGSLGASTEINNASYTPSGLKNLTITSGSIFIQNKDLLLQNTILTVPTNSQLYQNNNLTFTNSLTDINIDGFWQSNYNPTVTSQANLTIQSGGNLTTTQNTTVTNTPYKKIDLTFNNLTINSGGQINTNSKGFQGVNQGNGQGTGGGIVGSSYGGGGGYGGVGGIGASNNGTGGASYGSITEPIDLGSSGSGRNTPDGAGGNGGGAIKLNITGTLTNNGSITANGETPSGGYGGGGSGGSIWITTNTLAGSGTITANGGSGGSGYGGGGAGGRIALYYQVKTLSGTVSANGASPLYSQAGGAGTVYEPNTPQVGLTDAVFSPNPNPVSAGSTFTAQITNVKNTFGFNLFSGTCSVNITGPNGYSQNYSGVVNTGVCTISGSYPAPTVTGSGYTAALSVTGATTETKSVSFDVATAASNKAKIDTGSLPIYTSVTANPNNPLIGTNFNITGTGFKDSLNNQALNGIPCTINITGPNSYSNSFTTANIVGGNCSYSFDLNTLPKVAGTYSVTITVQGDSTNLTTSSVDFNYYFDIYLTNGSGFDATGKIPGNITSSQNTIVLNDPDPVFTSPVIRRFDNSTLIPTGTPCSILVTINSGPETAYNSTTNTSGQCVVTIPNNSFTGGSLSLRNRVTIQGNNFYTNPNTSILIQNFPSNKAKESTTSGQPLFASQTASPSPTLIGSNYILSVTGLQDSLINGRPLADLNCTVVINGPNNYSNSQAVAVTNGVCTTTLSGNIPLTPGQYSFKVQIAGDSSILETPIVNFDRFFNIKLTGGTPGISGSLAGITNSSQNPILLNTATTLTSPIVRNYADNANLSGVACRNILKINSGSNQVFAGTLNASGQCVTAVTGGSIAEVGTAYIKTQVSSINSDFDPAYTFENSNNIIQIRYAPTAQICANQTFRDDNKNGIKDVSEPLLAGVVTRLKDSTNTSILNTLITTAGGPNCFTNLFDDTYYLEQVLPAGGTLQTASQSYQVILGVAATENRSFGYNGDSVICPSPTFIDINQNGIYETGNGDYLLEGLVTNLYLTSDLNTSLQEITTNNLGTNCFDPKNPGNYTVIQNAPANTVSTTGTINSGKVSQNLTLAFGTNFNQKFGYRITPSQKAKAQAAPNETKPVYASIVQLTTVNPTYNEKAFVNYPVSATISGLIDSNTDLALNGTNICSATFDGPSFTLPITVTNLNVVNGSCLVDNTNNSSVIANAVGSNNTVVFTVQGPSTELISDPHTFEVFSGNSSICATPFADYNLDGVKQSNEPFLAGIQTQLFAGVNLLQTINSNINGTSCFTSIAPGIAYTITQTAPNGTTLTTGNLTRNITPFPETTNTENFAYKGDSTITPNAFRDDNRNGINNSETALNGIFTATLKDYAGNTISSNLSINGVNQFSNLLSNSVLGGNYSIEINTQGLLTTNTTSNSPATVSNLISGSNQNLAFGYASDSTICPNPSFYDYSKNGIKDGFEPNISGLTTRLLLASDNSQVATLTTNLAGTNCFTNVIPGNYILEQTHPIGAILTTTPGTQSSGTITTPVTSSFGVNQSRSFGYKGNSTICPNPSFIDLNKDGIKDSGENLISGLTTILRDTNGNTIATLTTNGSNCFTELLAGNYQVAQTPPSNSTSTTGGTTKSITLSENENLEVSFGYNGEPLVCPVVFRDDNGNGIKDLSEVSLEGSSLILRNSANTQVGNTIISNGTTQCFDPLTIAEDYTIQASTPNGYTATTSLTANITASFGQSYAPVFGFNGNATVCVINSFKDFNLNGIFDSGTDTSIAGLVTSIRVSGSSTPIQILPTDGNGQLCFNSLPPGQYQVIQLGGDGTSSTTGGNQTFNLTPAQTKNLTFGYTGSGVVCVDLYNDLNFNNRKDSGENYIPNITANLYLQSNLLAPIDTVVTNNNSNSCFDSLFAGDFQVKITTTGDLQNNGFVSTGSGDSQNITLDNQNNFYSIQAFGYTNSSNFSKGAIRGLVYVDRAENNLYNSRGQDDLEATVYDNDIAIVEKQVSLFKDSGGNNYVLQSTQITDTLGEFNFLGLEPGNYRVQIPNDTGITAVTPSPSTLDFTVTTNQKTYNLYGFQYTAQICPVIFVDKNNNGIFDGNDVDIIQTSGAFVQLEYQSFGGTQIYGAGSSNGVLLNIANPCITKVPPREYTLRLSGTNNFAAVFDTAYYTQKEPTGNPATSIFLGNTTSPTIRYYTNAVSDLSSIYGKIWNDRPPTASTIDLDGQDNQTGVQNFNGDNYDRDYDNDFAYAGINVSLQKCGPVAGETITDVNSWNANPPTTTTDINGNYSFSNIPTGAYAVIVNSTVAFQNQTTTVGKGVACNGFNYTFFNSLYQNGGGGVIPGSNIQYDIIYYYTPSVSASLWLDTNKDGIQNGWENWMPYTVDFEIANGNGFVASNDLKYFTGGGGNISSVVPDNYSLSILNNNPSNTNIPLDYGIIGDTTKNIDTTTGGKSVTFGLNPTQNSSFTGKVFIDRNNNNIFEPNGGDNNPVTTFDNDQKLSNVEINLYYGSGQNQLAANATTNTEGDYSFSGLAEGNYSLVITSATPTGTGCINCSGSVSVSKDATTTTNLRYNYNAGIRLSSYYDTIQNFVRDSEYETDVNQGTFTLIAPDGTQVGSPANPIIFDGNGSYGLQYQFASLSPGTYTIQLNDLPSNLRGFSNPDTITVSPSQTQQRDYPLEALTNNSISGDIFVDKDQGLNQGPNGNYNPNGGDNNPGTTFDNDEALTNTEVKIIGPLGTYTVSTNTFSSYSFSNLPSGKYKLFKLINNGTTSVPNLTLDTNNPATANIALQNWTSTSLVRNNNSNNHNFTYRYTNEISAYCYDDKDSNGRITYYPDSNLFERRSSSCSFEIETSDGQIIPLNTSFSAASDANGSYFYNYYFKSNLPPGSYILRNTNDTQTTVVTNFAAYEPSIVNYGLVRQTNINFTQNSLNQANRSNLFINFDPITNNASIIGKAYIDRNNNNIFEPNGADNNPNTLEDNDVGIKNLPIELTKLLPVLPGVSRSTTTDGQGNYQITDLPAGNFNLEADIISK